MAKPTYLIRHLGPTVLAADAEPLDPADEPLATLPLLGTVSAGQPIEAVEDPETIDLPEDLARRASFALRVRGDSMTEDGIEDGDLILVAQRPHAENGATVVALINGGEVTLKRLYVEAEGIRLQPANPEMAPLTYPHAAVEVLGVVSAVLHNRR
ncbi:LexA family protein [Thiohalocapsa marina]|uniref:LexA family protein n=1 Tax=Thiohalocapsa marina TaxID=424902 RepID=UPI0036DD481C